MQKVKMFAGERDSLLQAILARCWSVGSPDVGHIHCLQFTLMSNVVNRQHTKAYLNSKLRMLPVNTICHPLLEGSHSRQLPECNKNPVILLCK